MKSVCPMCGVELRLDSVGGYLCRRCDRCSVVWYQGISYPTVDPQLWLEEEV